MNVTLNTSSVKDLASVSEALQNVSTGVAAEIPAVLGGKNLNVAAAKPDVDELLAQLRMETNEARLNAARSRLSSALGQLSGLAEQQADKVDEMKNVGEDLLDAEAARDADLKVRDSRSKELDRAESALDRAESALDRAGADLTEAKFADKSARESLDAAQSALGEYLQRGGELDPAEQARLEEAVAEAQVKADSAGAALATASAAVDEARNSVAAAKESVDAAKKAVDAANANCENSEAKVSGMQARLDGLVSSLDASSINLLREALTILSGDLDHLHGEIEEDDKRHDLSPVRSVEDVIADALRRLDGKMVDEMEDRHLDHV